MNRVQRLLVWLSRIHHCRGFGIQSPTDYAFVRYVINEHWPYYAYDHLTDADWLTQKLGRLYFRLANWRQPAVMPSDAYQRYWQAGCRKTRFISDLSPQPSALSPLHIELARIDVTDSEAWQRLLPLCDDDSVLVVEGIHRDWKRWHQYLSHPRVTVAYDLYYCGIVTFDSKRYPHTYQVNF